MDGQSIPDAGLGALLAAASFAQQSSFEPAAAVSAPRPVTSANGHDDRTADAVDGLFGLDGPAVDLFGLLADERLFPATSKKDAKRSALDLVLEDFTNGFADEQLSEDLTLALA